MKVTIKPYNPVWATEFQKPKASLEIILKDVPVASIEHVGSTSISGLPAKPVIDIDIIVTPDALLATMAALWQAGYFDCGEVNVPGRFAFRQPGFGKLDAAWVQKGSGSGEMRRNTYAMIEGCVALRHHLDIKRVLMSDAGLREEEYGRIKMELTERDYGHIGEYVMTKNEIHWKILERAGGMRTI
jgi:GrpB-like predicted nucleotidyltransferase (UPF0157 family)